MTSDVVTFRRTYGGGAADYAKGSDLWPWCPERTIALLDLQADATVLDMACGPGGLTVLAAQRIGPGGSVTAVDLSTEMLDITTDRAQERGLGNVVTEIGDLDAPRFEPESFDVVMCGLAIYFAQDIMESVRRLWALVRPGGKLAISTCGRAFFSPLTSVYLRAVREEAPGVDRWLPWDRTEDPVALRERLVHAGLAGVEVTIEGRDIPIADVEAFKPIVIGTGLRHIHWQLDRHTQGRVWGKVAAAIAEGVRSVRFDTIHAVATKG